MRKTIKKMIISLCAAGLVLSLTACGSSAAVVTTTADSGSRETLPNKPAETSAAQTTVPVTEQPTETAAPQTTQEATLPAETTQEQPIEPMTTEPESAEPESGTQAEDLQERIAKAYTKYQHLLAEHLDLIENSLFTITDPNGEQGRPMQVVVADIHGDEIPEIIFLEAGKGESGVDVQLLKIFTYYGETIEEMFEEQVDIAAGGGKMFCLFQNGEDKEPWLQIYGGEYVTARRSLTRLRFERVGDGAYRWTGTRFNCVEIQENAEPGTSSEEEEWVFTDSSGSESLTKEEYYARRDPILAEMIPLIHNFNSYYMPEGMEGRPMQAVSFDEALALLEEGIEGEDETLEPSGKTSELFETIQGEYFQHGGDWTTMLTVYADGSFSGEYTAHYNSANKTHYDVGEFHGYFSDPQQIDELTWTMRVEKLFVDGEAGKEWETEDGTYTQVSDPASPVEGSELTVYLPGTDSKNIPEEFFMWIRSSAEQLPTLPGTALINDEGESSAYYYRLPEDG